MSIATPPKPRSRSIFHPSPRPRPSDRGPRSLCRTLPPRATHAAPPPAPPHRTRAAVAFDVPDHSAARYAVATDKETTATAVEISDLRPARNQGSVGGYRELMLEIGRASCR